MAPDGRTCTKETMVKPTEPNDSPNKANLVVTICNGKRIFRASPFPSINASARNRANAFNRWEKAVLTQMNLQAPVEELLGQLEHYIPIKTVSAQMKMDRITEEVYDSFFKISNLEGSYFCSKYHEEILFGRSVKNRPAGLEFFRLTAEVNPATLYPYIREPTMTVSFYLSLAQKPKTTSTPASTSTRSALNHRIDIRPCSGTPATIRRVLFDDEGQQASGPLPVMESANGSDDDVASASPALARCLQRFQGTGDDSVVVVSYHGPVNFLEDQATFDDVFQNRKPFDPHWADNPLVQQ
jgi:hypothetical protein